MMNCGELDWSNSSTTERGRRATCRTKYYADLVEEYVFCLNHETIYAHEVRLRMGQRWIVATLTELKTLGWVTGTKKDGYKAVYDSRNCVDL